MMPQAWIMVKILTNINILVLCRCILLTRDLRDKQDDEKRERRLPLHFRYLDTHYSPHASSARSERMGNCCHKDTKYATYKKELGAPLLKELKTKGLPEGGTIVTGQR
jgi:hypothetical protein